MTNRQSVLDAIKETHVEGIRRRLGHLIYGGEGGMEFLGRPVKAANVQHDVRTDRLTIEFTLDGSVPPILRDLSGNAPPAEVLKGLTCTHVGYDPKIGQTKITLCGSYDKFLGYAGDWSPGPRTSQEQAIVNELEDALREADAPEVNEMDETVMGDFKENVVLASKVALSNAAMEQMMVVLQQRLAAAGVDTAFMSAPAARALIKMALPLGIMMVLDLEPVTQALPDGVRTTVRDLANSAQLGASIEGMQTLMGLVVPMLMEFAAVSGSLTEGNGAPALSEFMTATATEVP